MLITGVGGTGVVTIGAILAMAAHLEGKGVGVIDMAGLAQKGGPVTSHVRIAPTPGSVKAIRVAAGGADTILACDMVVAGTAKSLAAIHPNRTRVFVNTHETYPGEFTRDPDMTLPTAAAACGDHRPGRHGADPHDRGDGDRHRTPRRCDRHQHVHARLRVAVGGDPAHLGGDRAGDRTERRRRRDEQGGLRLGTPRRGRAGHGGADRRAASPDGRCRRSRRWTRSSNGGPASSPPTRTRAMRAATAPRSSASARRSMPRHPAATTLPMPSR